MSQQPPPVNHRRGPWATHEDDLLVRLVSQYGAEHWVHIQGVIQTRSAKQCRERWHQNLKPELRKDPITDEEGDYIRAEVDRIGKRWADIARKMDSRSDNTVKNWWNGQKNRQDRLTKKSKSRADSNDMEDHAGYSLHRHHSAPTACPPSYPYPDHRMPPRYRDSRAAPYPQLHYSTPGDHRDSTAVPRHVPSTPPANSYWNDPLPSPAFSSASERPPSLCSDNGTNWSTSPKMGVDRTLPPLARNTGEKQRLPSFKEMFSSPSSEYPLPTHFDSRRNSSVGQYPFRTELHSPIPQHLRPPFLMTAPSSETSSPRDDRPSTSEREQLPRFPVLCTKATPSFDSAPRPAPQESLRQSISERASVSNILNDDSRHSYYEHQVYRDLPYTSRDNRSRDDLFGNDRSRDDRFREDRFREDRFRDYRIRDDRSRDIFGINYHARPEIDPRYVDVRGERTPRPERPCQ